MTSARDDICKKFINILRKEPKSYAGLQREARLGSFRTVKNHVKHLVEDGLAKDKRKRQGANYIREVSLTNKGRRSK